MSDKIAAKNEKRNAKRKNHTRRKQKNKMGNKDGKESKATPAAAETSAKIRKLIKTQLNMKKWSLVTSEFDCYPGLIFFYATEPDSFAHDRGENVVGGVVDINSEKAYRASDKSVSSILATSLNNKYPSRQDKHSLPPVDQLIEAEEMLYMHGGLYLAKDKSRLEVWQRDSGESGELPRVERNEEGWIELSYCYYSINNVPDPAKKRTRTFKVKR